MNKRSGARFVAVAVLCLWTAIAIAQEQPAPTPATETPAEPAVAPPPAATPAPEASPAVEPAPVQEAAPTAAAPAPTEIGAAARPGAKRIVVLPVDFTVYERSVAGVEAVPDWSESAQFALGDATGKMLRLDNRFEIVAMPKIEGDSAALLREHVALFKIVAITVSNIFQFGGKAWKPKWENFDYTLGDGLGFLADAAQADYALFLAGAQVKQTGGSAFMQFLVGTPGGGTFVAIGVITLRTGDLAWFNWKQGMEMWGMTGSDVRDPATAHEVVSKMFVEYPGSKQITFKPF